MQRVLMLAVAVAMIAGAANAVSIRYTLSGRGMQGASTRILSKAPPRPAPGHGMGARRDVHPAHLRGVLIREKQTFTYSGAWVHDAASVQEGENWIENAWSSDACGGGPLSAVQFNPYTYTIWYFTLNPKVRGYPMFYSAKQVSGTFTCG
jgi:hypothetical protein